MRDVDHCIEALCTDRSTALVDESAEEGLRQLVPGLLTCNADGSDIQARGMYQVGAWKAMESIHRKIPLGASYAIGHQIGRMAGVPRVETSCFLLPNKGVNGARQERVANTLWGVAGGAFEGLGLSREESDTGDLIKSLVRTLGLPITLGGVGW